MIQVKALTFSSDIGSHDLSTKLKQVQTWLDKKNHVRLTLQARRHASSTTPLVSHWSIGSKKIRTANNIILCIYYITIGTLLSIKIQEVYSSHAHTGYAVK